MGEVSTWAKIFTTLIAIAVAYWVFIFDKESSLKRQERDKEEEILIDDTVHLTTTRNTFEKHRDFIFDRAAVKKEKQ